jgi:imidazolonepropionase-like amidohydrolase
MSTPRVTFPRSGLLRALLAAWLLPLTAGFAQTPAVGAPIFFRQVRVFDGMQIQRSRDVLVASGRIVRIAARLAAPSGATIIEGRGRTLLPGLIDAHVHTWADAPRQALMFGVTTELDMFMDHRLARTLRAEQRAGPVTGRADVLSAGTLVTAPDGHGTEYGVPIPTLTAPDSAQAFVDARIGEGSDWIKIVYDDGHGLGRRIATLSEATLRATVAAAKAREKLSVVHITDLGSARTAIDAGADGLAHLFTDSAADPAFVALMQRRKAFVIPTLSVLATINGTGAGARLARDERLAPWLGRQERQVLTQTFPPRAGAPPIRYSAAEESIRSLRAAGVPILAGTDAGNPGTAHGAAMHLEVELLVAAGLTPLEALRAATAVPARIFHLADRGRIAPGLRADLLLVDGDPASDITATRAIAGIWKAGVAVDRTPFREAVAASLRGAPVPAGLGEGLISTFDEGTMAARFGAGWMASDDAIAGGDSKAALRVVNGALEVSGTRGGKLPYGWAGAMFSPGATPFAAADLSSKREVVFRVRGDSATLHLLAFSERRGQMPIQATFTARAEWREVVIPFSALGGIDGRDVQALILSAGSKPGPFRFEIDEIRLR